MYPLRVPPHRKVLINITENNYEEKIPKLKFSNAVEKLEKDNSDLRNRIEKLEKLIEENK